MADDHRKVRAATAAAQRRDKAYGRWQANKTLYSQLPHIPSFHRPTKAELLAAATGRWNRLAIRFKWFSIRSSRPFNSDDISAFISWILWGHVLWIILFTTTFVSLAIYAVNTVFAQETVAGWVGSYLTKSSGVKVVFESAIVPTWRDGTITFRNVFVSRRPGQNGGTRQRAVSKGSSTSAAAAAASAALLAESKPSAGEMQDVHDDGNYTQFDLTIETINVTLSFTKWFNGHGLLNNVEVRGVRGVLDRTFLKPLQQGETAPDPKSYRHTHNTGDFEIDAFKMEDVLLTVYQPREFRPFTVSVFNCELPRLRKQWLFYDFMNANNMSGAFDGSLFTVHPRQLHSTTGALLIEGSESGEKAWKKHSRLRIDGLNIDHLNRGVQGPFSWIYEGNVDLVADVMIPHDEDEGIVKVMKEVYDKVEEKVKEVAEKTLPSTATATPTPLPRTRPRQEDDYVIHNNYDQFSASPLPLPAADPPIDTDTSPPLILDIRIHLNDVRAHVPLFTRDLSYINTALVRPIVAYINASRAFIPVNCQVIKHQSEFDGSWTIFDSGLLDDLSREVYEAFVNGLADEGVRGRRMRKVGGWAVGWVVRALFEGLVGQIV